MQLQSLITNDDSKIDNILKEKLLNQLYDIIDLNRFKYETLEYTDDLKKIYDFDITYLIPNYYGINCLLFYTKIENEYFSVLINKKKINYNKNKTLSDLNNVDMILISTNAKISYYEKSIMEGIFIKNNMKKSFTFVISDIFIFEGQDKTHIDLNIKLTNFLKILETSPLNFNNQSSFHNINSKNKLYQFTDLKVSKIYSLFDFDSFVEENITRNTNFKIRGIYFHPNISGMKLVYTLDTKNIKTVKKITYEPIENKKIIKYKFIADPDKNIFATFVMEKTTISDIYNLYALELINKNNLEVVRKKSMGVAYIKSREMSEWCNKIFIEEGKPISKNNNLPHLLIKCKFNHKQKQWEPIEIEKNKKQATFLNEIDIKLMEIYDSDDD